MPEGIPYASSNVVAGSGKDLNYVGNHVFAYSKAIGVSNSETALLETTTGNKSIKCEVTFQYCTPGNHDYHYIIYLNGVIVFNQFMDNTAGIDGRKSNQLFAIPLFIPPYTALKCTAVNVTASDTESQACSLVGTVHG